MGLVEGLRNSVRVCDPEKKNQNQIKTVITKKEITMSYRDTVRLNIRLRDEKGHCMIHYDAVQLRMLLDNTLC